MKVERKKNIWNERNKIEEVTSAFSCTLLVKHRIFLSHKYHEVNYQLLQIMNRTHASTLYYKIICIQ